MPSSCTPARLRSGASCAPAQRALPTPPWKNGRPVLPEHSRVKSTSRRGRLLEVGQRQRPRPVDQAGDLEPPVGGRQPRLVVVVDDEEVIGRREPGVQLLPHQLVRAGRLAGRSTGEPPPRPGAPETRAPARPPSAPSAQRTPPPHPSTGCGGQSPVPPLVRLLSALAVPALLGAGPQPTQTSHRQRRRGPQEQRLAADQDLSKPDGRESLTDQSRVQPRVRSRTLRAARATEARREASTAPAPTTYIPQTRRGGRVVECTGLENRRRGNSSAGSNPAPSASRVAGDASLARR